MSIRNSAKAIIIENGKILLNKCNKKMTGNSEIYYDLPGGGQNKYESMCDALIRECFEETGYKIKPIRFVALYEEIYLSSEYQQKFPDYAHKIYHIFKCELKNIEVKAPKEKDFGYVCSEWIDIENIHSINIVPKALKDSFNIILESTTPIFLDTLCIR